MPAWIHKREQDLEQKMQKTYGPEKAKQVAFAVATQQSHKLGKSPKSYGTAKGRQEAKMKFDKPIKEYDKTAAALTPELAKRMQSLQSKLSVVQPNQLVRLIRLQKKTGTLRPKIGSARFNGFFDEMFEIMEKQAGGGLKELLGIKPKRILNPGKVLTNTRPKRTIREAMEEAWLRANTPRSRSNKISG